MHTSRTVRLAAATVGLTLFVGACGSDKEAAAPTTPATVAGAGEAPAGGVICEGGVTIAFLGAISGDRGALGTNMVNGASIAVDDFNAVNPDCKVTFATQYDSQGIPDQAIPLATTIVNDDDVIGLIGPGFSSEVNATMPEFETAGLPMVSPAATSALLSTHGWKMFHRVLPNDDKQGTGVVRLIKDTIKGTKVGVIDDGSVYAKALADPVRAQLGDLDVADAAIVIEGGDFSAAVTAMKDAEVDTVFYSGFYPEAALMLTQLRDAGVEATFVAGNPVRDQAFVEAAGAVADGTYITSTAVPPDVNAEFGQKFSATFGTAPAQYSPEAYDAIGVFLAGISAGNVTRADLAAFIDTYDAPGITQQIKFDETGEPATDAVFYTVVEQGTLVSKGLVP